MTPGIRAELRVPAAVDCPLAQVSAAENVTAYSVSKSVDPTAPTNVTEEFSVDATGDEELALEGMDLETAFDGSSESVYRFERVAGRNCPCECIEHHGYPVVAARGENGTLYITFHVPDQDALRGVIGTIGESHPQVEVRRLVQSRDNDDEATDSLVFFDKSVLTERQTEVLRTAHRMGYFDHPKGANAGEVADELDITTATFTEHLAAAQRKLLDSILDTD